MKNFKKIILTVLLSVLVIVPSTVYASTTVKDEEGLVKALATDGTIVLDDSITVSNPINLQGKTITLDLNGHSIKFAGGKNKVRLNLKSGSLNITGNGSIIEDVYYTAPIVVYGAETDSGENYSVLTIGKEVTVKGYYGIFVSYDDTKSVAHAYGAVININGSVYGGCDAKDATDCGASVYINGNIKDLTGNIPIFNINNGANLISTESGGIYSAGIATWNIDGATINAKDFGIGIKSGTLNIKNTNIKVTGPAAVGTYNGSGINPTGAALQIESNNGYAGNITVDIENSKFESVNGKAFYHYFAAPTGSTQTVKNSLLKLTIDGVNFKGGIDFVEKDNVTIKSGTFTSSVSDYLTNGYTESVSDGVYTVKNVTVTGEGLLINGKEGVTYVKPGSTVTLSAKALYELTSVVVKDYEGNDITVTNGKFTMPEKAVTITAKTVKLYNLSVESNKTADVKFTVNNSEVETAKAGDKVKFSYTVKDGYVFKSLSLVNADTKKAIEISDNTFTMPSAGVLLTITTEEKGEVKEVTKPIEVNSEATEEVKEVVAELAKVEVDNSNTGLAQAVEVTKLEGVTETDKVEVSISTKVENYDKEKNTLVFEIKPIYSVNGVEKGIIPNALLTKSIKVEVPVPSTVTDTYAKVLHKSGDKVLDTKNYEIKTRGEGKYITIETESFSTFELSFYTPEKESNPITSDGAIGYILLTVISMLGISSGALLLRKKMSE